MRVERLTKQRNEVLWAQKLDKSSSREEERETTYEEGDAVWAERKKNDEKPRVEERKHEPLETPWERDRGTRENWAISLCIWNPNYGLMF